MGKKTKKKERGGGKGKIQVIQLGEREKTFWDVWLVGETKWRNASGEHQHQVRQDPYIPPASRDGRIQS